MPSPTCDFHGISTPLSCFLWSCFASLWSCFGHRYLFVTVVFLPSPKQLIRDSPGGIGIIPPIQVVIKFFPIEFTNRIPPLNCNPGSRVKVHTIDKNTTPNWYLSESKTSHISARYGLRKTSGFHVIHLERFSGLHPSSTPLCLPRRQGTASLQNHHE